MDGVRFKCCADRVEDCRPVPYRIARPQALLWNLTGVSKAEDFLYPLTFRIKVAIDLRRMKCVPVSISHSTLRIPRHICLFGPHLSLHAPKFDDTIPKLQPQISKRGDRNSRAVRSGKMVANEISCR